MIARLAELVGVRRLYRAFSYDPYEPQLPDVRTAETAVLNRTWLTEQLQAFQYHLTANVFRGLFYAHPMAAAIAVGEPILISLVGFVLLIHVLVISTELYRLGLLRRLIPNGDETPMVTRSTPAKPGKRSEVWFRPCGWESDELYERLGLRAFNRVVTAYEKNTGLKEDESGAKAKGIRNPHDVLKFEFRTRKAEVVHGVGLLLNVLIVGTAIWKGVAPAIWWPLPMLLIDGILVPLQRHHRVRCWRMITTLRRRAA